MTGATVGLHVRTQTGVDAFNDPLYTDTVENVANVLIGQPTTDEITSGIDLYGKKSLPELLKKLCAIDGIRWIRLLYAYPEEITDEMIDVIASEDKICKYLDSKTRSDIPLRDMKIIHDWSGFYYDGTVYTDAEEEEMIRKQFNIPKS